MIRNSQPASTPARAQSSVEPLRRRRALLLVPLQPLASASRGSSLQDKVRLGWLAGRRELASTGVFVAESTARNPRALEPVQHPPQPSSRAASPCTSPAPPCTGA